MSPAAIPAPPGDEFTAAVARVLHDLQPGEVVTYGDVAADAGYPGRARAVGRLLAAGDHDVAWWRVVTAGGRLVPGLEEEQARRLRAEGVDPAALPRMLRRRRATPGAALRSRR